MPRDSLDAVYRLISSSSYAEAVHHINKILKKQPNYLIAQIWKCEALHGLGNITESEELMETIIQQSPSDRRTVESIADFYRARGNYNKLVEVYENVLKHDPTDEIFRKALFECCGLAGDYKKQQLQALHLYKQSPRMLFYCMAVVCLLQQAEENPVALDLAERMMVKQIEVGKIKSRHEILLHITVLEKRGKFEEALHVFNQSASELEALLSTSDKRIELLSKLERWTDVVKELKLKLKEKPDHWNYLKQYVHASIKAEESGLAVDDPEIDDSFKRIQDFLLSLSASNPTLRGPHLAVLELYKTHRKQNPQTQLIISIVDYFKSFGDKAISVFDISQYVTLIPKENLPELLSKLSVPDYATINHVRLQNLLGTLKHISFLQLSRFLGLNLDQTSQDRELLCQSLVECYEVADGCERSEHYIIIAAQERLALYNETGDVSHLLSAAYILENALTKTGVFVVQVLLLQVYFLLGASKSAKKLYERLRIQSVQVDTLIHLFLYNISSTGYFAIASEMWENALKILQQCTAECLEALVWCYRAGLYHRVEEFTNCARRFQKTISAPLLRCEKAFLDLLTGEPAKAEHVLGRLRPVVQWDSCIDNRDLKAIPFWDPPTVHRPREQSYSELLLLCKVRESTMLCLEAALNYGKTRQDKDKTLFSSYLDRLQDQYMKAAALPKSSYHMLTSCSTRLHLIVQVPLPSMIEKTLEPDLASSEKICTMLKQSTDICIDIIEKNKAQNPRIKMETLVTQMEALSVMTVAVGGARQKLAATPKRRCVQIMQALESCWLEIEAICTLESFLAIPSKEALYATLLENYQSALDEIRKVIRKKITYLHRML